MAGGGAIRRPLRASATFAAALRPMLLAAAAALAALPVAAIHPAVAVAIGAAALAMLRMGALLVLTVLALLVLALLAVLALLVLTVALMLAMALVLSGRRLGGRGDGEGERDRADDDLHGMSPWISRVRDRQESRGGGGSAAGFRPLKVARKLTACG